LQPAHRADVIRPGKPHASHLNASAHASTHQEHALADIEALKLVRRHHLIRLNGDGRDAQ
jgi:hypothetical protein